jgi:hypothetical protein
LDYLLLGLPVGLDDEQVEGYEGHVQEVDYNLFDYFAHYFSSDVVSPFQVSSEIDIEGQQFIYHQDNHRKRQRNHGL